MSESVDLDYLRDKYAKERERRLVPEKSSQWTEITDQFEHYSDDPYVEPGFTREPIVDQLEVLVIGGGFGGLFTAAKLRQAGIDNFRIIEKAGDFGGTWYWNRYPGVQCDIESYIYLPLLEETGYVPKEKYAYGAEILEHTHRIADHFGLRDRALFQTAITELRWSEEDGLWTVRTDRGDNLTARFVVSSSGPLNRPQLPGVPGIEDFKGHAFHTSRWDYAYTGGHSRGDLHKLADKRVAIVGTGATAIQCVPFLAESAGHLYVVQRTPSVVGERGNRPTEPGWAEALTPGWQRRRSDNFEDILEGGRPGEDYVSDGWTYLSKRMRPDPQADSRLAPDVAAQLAEQRDFECGEEVRARVDSIVTDRQTAEALKPWYRIYCKRPTFNDEYLASFNRENVTLVDTKGAGLDRITERGFVAGGMEYEVDCIIFATGFDTGSDYAKRSEFEVHGVGGKTLSEHHRAGTRTYHGFYSNGFPNFFILGASQNGFRANFTKMLDEQSDHIVSLLQELRARGCVRVEASAEAEEHWQEVIRNLAKARISFLTTCTPGYYNAQGDVERGFFVNVYNGGANAFAAMLRDWWSKGDMEGLALS